MGSRLSWNLWLLVKTQIYNKSISRICLKNNEISNCDYAVMLFINAHIGVIEK